MVLEVETAAGKIALPERPDAEVHATSETYSLKLLRRRLINERGSNREYLAVSGHWRRGTSDYDHHEAMDD